MVARISSQSGPGRVVPLPMLGSLVSLLADQVAANPDGFELRLMATNDVFPNMVIAVRKQLAYLFHFPADGHAGYQSLGEPAAANLRFTFPMASVLHVAGSQVVSFDHAVVAALEFLTNPTVPPASLAWVERH